MGNCCPCFGGSSSADHQHNHAYQPVPTNETVVNDQHSNVEMVQTPYQVAAINQGSIADQSGTQNNVKPIELNLYSNVFSGAEVLQKFHNSLSYTTR